MQEGVRAGARPFEQPSRFLDAPFVEEEEPDGEALILGKPGDKAEEFLDVVECVGIGTGLRQGLFRQGIEAPEASMFPHDETSDAHKPGCEPRRVAEGVQGPECPEECFVGDVFGAVWACIAGDRADQAESPIVERAEGRDVPGHRPSNQFVVGRLFGHYTNE